MPLDYSRFDAIIDSDEEEPTPTKPKPAATKAITAVLPPKGERRAAAAKNAAERDSLVVAAAAENDAPALHVLMATDVQDEARLRCLQRCLDALVVQRFQCTVHVGWHAAAGLREQTLSILQAFASACDAVLSESPSRRSQFEHFASLSADLAVGCSPARAWILFHDDDDISHPNRNAHYFEAVMRARLRVIQMGADPADERAPRAIQCAEVALPNDDTHAPRVRIATAADVDAALRAGAAVGAPASLDLREYWSFAVRLDLMREFCRTQPASVLAHRLADLRFRQWLGGHHPLTFSSASWLYFYDDSAGDAPHAAGGRHGHRMQTAEDAALASKAVVAAEDVTHMRRLGETGFVVGFDGPKLHLSKSDAELRERAVELMLQAVKLPRATRGTSQGDPLPAKWAVMNDAERARHVQVAQAMADGLVAEARRTFGEAVASDLQLS